MTSSAVEQSSSPQPKRRVVALVGVAVTVGVAIAIAVAVAVSSTGHHHPSTKSQAAVTTTASNDHGGVVAPAQLVRSLTTPQQQQPMGVTSDGLVSPVLPNNNNNNPAQAASGLFASLKSPPDAEKRDPGQLFSAASNTAGGDGPAVADGTCYAADGAELIKAVEEQACGTVVLTSSAVTLPDGYVLEREIVVSRPVSITGNPTYLPRIDPSHAVRGFRVVAGGFLNLQGVTMGQGMGEAVSGGIRTETRGGSVMFQAGALGGSFRGVMFESLSISEESAKVAMQLARGQLVTQVYGGFVYMAGGSVDFVGCVFNDIYMLTGFSTGTLIVGGDVLVLAGTASFTGCAFGYTSFFDVRNVVGLEVAVFGGVVNLFLCSIHVHSLFAMLNGAGIGFFVGGGVMTMTGVDYGLHHVGLCWTGIGTFFVGGGAMVLTGGDWFLTNVLMANMGAGMWQAVGGGVLIQTGTSITTNHGPTFMAMSGGTLFLGAGSMVITGCALALHWSSSSFYGQGGIIYVGSGDMVMIGSPMWDFAALRVFIGLGGHYALGAGAMVLIGSSLACFYGLIGAAGQGQMLYVGAGLIVNYFSGWYAACGNPQRGSCFTNQMWNAWVNGCYVGYHYWPILFDCTGPTQSDFAGCGCHTKAEKCNGPVNPACTPTPRRNLLASSSVAYSDLTDYVKGQETSVYVVLPESSPNRTADDVIKSLGTAVPKTLSSARAARLVGRPITDQLYVRSADTCTVCRDGNGSAPVDLATMGGPGADVCRHEADCSQADSMRILGVTPHDNKASAAAPSVSVLFAQVALTCTPDNATDCASPNAVRDALKSVVPDDFRVAVVKDEVDPMFARDFARGLEEEEATTTTTTTTGAAIVSTYKAFLVGLSDKSADQVTSQLQSAEGVGGAQDSVMAQLARDDRSSGGLSGVAIKYTKSWKQDKGKSLTRPTVSRHAEEGEEEQGSAMIDSLRTVEVVREDTPNAPLGPITAGIAGKQYQILMRNFPEGRQLKVEVAGAIPVASHNGGSAVVEYRQVLAKAHAYSTTSDDGAMMSWTPSAQMHGPGSFYIRVTDVESGVVEVSPVFAIGRKSRHRSAGPAGIRHQISTMYTA